MAFLNNPIYNVCGCQGEMIPTESDLKSTLTH